jgi:hypothetical protein
MVLLGNTTVQRPREARSRATPRRPVGFKPAPLIGWVFLPVVKTIISPLSTAPGVNEIDSAVDSGCRPDNLVSRNARILSRGKSMDGTERAFIIVVLAGFYAMVVGVTWLMVT